MQTESVFEVGRSDSVEAFGEGCVGGGEMSLVKEDIRKAMEHLDILTAQIGNARIRKLYKDPLKDFIKKVEITLAKGAK